MSTENRVRLGTVAAGINQLKRDLEILEAEKKTLLETLIPSFEEELARRGKGKTLYIECGDGINYKVSRSDFKTVDYPLEIMEEIAVLSADKNAALKASSAPFEAELEKIKLRAEHDPRTSHGVKPRWSVTST